MELLKKAEWLAFKKKALEVISEANAAVAENKKLKTSIAKMKAKASTTITIDFSLN